MNNVSKTALFELGRTLITPGAKNSLNPDDVTESLRRHEHGDWGRCCFEDRLANNDALKHGARIFSVYQDRRFTKFWIITEADRSSTTVLLPEEY